MSRSPPPLVGAALAVALAAAVLPSAATADADGSLRGLRLAGEDTCGFKTVYAVPTASYLFAPLALRGEDFARTHTVLVPHEVTISGEGLKARHLLPDTYTAKGPEPTGAVTCSFEGETREAGEFAVEITGVLRGRPADAP